MKTEVLLLIGGRWHAFPECASILKEGLERTGACSCVVTEDLTSLENLRGFDAVMLYTQGGRLSRAQERSLCRFVREGGGLVGIHSASDSFASNKQFLALLGTRLASHGPVGEVAVSIARGSGPAAARIGDFRIEDEFYLLRRTGPDLAIHASGEWQGQRHPLVYTRTHGKGRVFYTALGHDERAFRHPAFQRLIWRGLRFVTGALEEGPIRTVVIGYGQTFDMGRLHAEAVRNVEGLELLGVCDTDPRRREAARGDWGSIRSYASVKEVAIDPDVGLGIIVTPHDTHAALALALARAGKHVVCEKPFAITAKECGQVLAAAKRKKVMVSVVHNRRWDGDFRAIRGIVESGAIGEVFHVELGMGAFAHPGHWWRSDRKQAGGVFYDWGAHLVDWVLCLIPGRVTQVTGFFQKRVWHDVSIDDWASVVMCFEGNRSAMIELGQITAAPRPKWRILGTRGSVWGDWGLEHVSVSTYGAGRVVSEKVPIEEATWEGYHRDVADHLLTGSPLAVTGEAGARVVAVIEAAGTSARAGRALAVDI